VDDDDAILISDIFPTGWFGADMAEIEPGDTVVVFGCGPVGQFAIASALLMDAGRVLAVDAVESRLDMARGQGAEVINFDQEDPVEAILELTGGIGADRAIDAVGVDAEHPHAGPAAEQAREQEAEFREEVEEIAPDRDPVGDLWNPGDAPSQVLRWATTALAKAGTLSIIGVYAEDSMTFPIGEAMNKNLAMNMGNCHHRKYIPHLVELAATGAFHPSKLLTQLEPLTDAIAAFEAFDRREQGWTKVELVPRAQ
jgi:threonine dehydrogenase-like Zn-dependent dehydrogenase